MQGNPTVRPTKTVLSEADRTARKEPPYLLYALLVGGILLARAFDLATQNSEWSIAIYQSAFWNRTLLLLAIIASSGAAFYLKRHLPPLMAWLSCGIVGGISMMLVNSIPGAFIGLVIGAAVVATAPSTSIVTFFGRTIVPSMFLGFATGAFSAAAWFYVGSSVGGLREILSVAVPLLVGGLISWKILTLTLKNRRWYGWIGATTLFVGFSFVGLVWQVDSRLDAIRNSFMTSIASSHGPGLAHAFTNFFPSATQPKRETIRRIEAFLNKHELPNPGYWGYSLYFDERSTAADIANAARLPFIASVSIADGCRITDEQFGKLNLRRTTSLHCGPGTKLTAKMLENIRFSQLQWIHLEGEQFGDDVFPYIKGTPPAWFSLALKDTRVTPNGLSTLAGKASIPELDLSGTQVDDQVFSALSGLTMLQWLNLSGTNITGEGIEQLPRSVRRLDLSNTQFESKHLAILSTSEDMDVEIWDTFFLEALMIRNTRFDRASTKTLLKLANSLQQINVSGLDLPIEVLQQLKAPVYYGLDATTLNPENIHLIKQAWLDLHYDAEKMSAAEIVEHFMGIKEVREKLFKTRPHNETPVVENLELTRESLRPFGLAELNNDGVSFRFIDAKIGNRRISEIHGAKAARSRFPELGGWDETETTDK